MRIVFFGVYHLGAASLERLSDQGVTIGAVVTKPDDLGQVQVVAEKGRQLGLPVLQPATLEAHGLHDALSACEPDLIVVAGYHLRLPSTLLAIPRLGAINAHLSMLPSYRGPAPYKWAIINGEPTSGVTVHVMTERFDAGDIIAQRSLPIADHDTADSLFLRLSDVAGGLLVETVQDIGEGKSARSPQDESRASYQSSPNDVDAQIDWRADAHAIHRLVRGLTARPGAWFVLDSERVRVSQARILGHRSGRPPGTILSRDDRSVVVATGTRDMRMHLR